MQVESENHASEPEKKPAADSGTPPDFNASAVTPIAELLVDPDFPKSALGKSVDIGGYVGIVANVVSHSLKVRSPEGVTKSFNVGGLRKLYGPRAIPEPMEISAPPVAQVAPRPREFPRKAPAPVVVVKRDIITDPDYSKPVVKIGDMVARPDFPKCAFGAHVDVAGYVGVVVEIVQRSLKVRSQAETTRSYNADALRKLYGKPGS